MPLVVWRQPPKHNIWWCYRRVLPHMLWFGCIWSLLQNLPHERRVAGVWPTLRRSDLAGEGALLQPRVGVETGEPEVPGVGQQDRHKADH